jgi:hypothetical protein
MLKKRSSRSYGVAYFFPHHDSRGTPCKLF